MASFHGRNGAGELLARYSFLEPLLEGRRVLEVGAARTTGGASALFLAERGAAAVLSIEPEEADLAAARAAGPHPFVQFQVARPAALRPGAFDLVLLADGSSFASAPHGVAELRRLLAPGGRLVTAIPAGGTGLADLEGEPAQAGPPYEAFVNALSDEFRSVEVATQSATVGWVFGLASEGEPDIVMDGTLAGTAETACYVTIAGEEPSGLSGFTLVALPVGPLVETARVKSERAADEVASVRARVAELEGMALGTEKALAVERARGAEQSSALAALEIERDAALHARKAAEDEVEALRSEREQAIRARDAFRAEAEEALLERDRALEAIGQREAEREALLRERDASRAQELEALRTREVALAEAVSSGESLARSDARAVELTRERDAALAAREEAAKEAAELRLSLEEARLAAGALESQVASSRDEGARFAARAQELEVSAGDREKMRSRAQEAEALAEAERESSAELRAQLERAQSQAAVLEGELGSLRSGLAAGEEERARLETALADHRSGSLESEAALQAARSESQAARAALEAALDRATRAEGRTAELEEALEGSADRAAREAAGAEEAEGLRRRIAELEEEGERTRAAEARAAALESELLDARARLKEAAPTAEGVGAEGAASPGGAGPAVEALPGRGEPEGLAAQLALASEARAELETKLSELRESSERKIAEARRAAYEAAAKAEASKAEAEAARQEVETIKAGAAGAAETAREWAQLREALEAQVAELSARLETEADRAGILSAKAAEARAQLESAALPGPEKGQGATPAALEKELAEARAAADQAEARTTEIAAELQAVRWEKDEIEQRLKATQGGGAGASPELGRLRDELAARMAEQALQKREVERLEAVVASLSVRVEEPNPSYREELEAQLDVAVQRATDAEAALAAARAQAAGDQGEALRKASQEREALSAQVAERDGKIARLQREVADKTERLGRLAKELGELKAKGLGKIFR